MGFPILQAHTAFHNSKLCKTFPHLREDCFKEKSGSHGRAVRTYNNSSKYGWSPLHYSKNSICQVELKLWLYMSWWCQWEGVKVSCTDRGQVEVRLVGDWLGDKHLKTVATICLIWLQLMLKLQNGPYKVVSFEVVASIYLTWIGPTEHVPSPTHSNPLHVHVHLLIHLQWSSLLP